MPAGGSPPRRRADQDRVRGRVARRGRCGPRHRRAARRPGARRGRGPPSAAPTDLPAADIGDEAGKLADEVLMAATGESAATRCSMTASRSRSRRVGLGGGKRGEADVGQCVAPPQRRARARSVGGVFVAAGVRCWRPSATRGRTRRVESRRRGAGSRLVRRRRSPPSRALARRETMTRSAALGFSGRSWAQRSSTS